MTKKSLTDERTDAQTDDSTKSIGHIFQKCALKKNLVEIQQFTIMKNSIQKKKLGNSVLKFERLRFRSFFLEQNR
jgi:hypothetical protein